MKNYKVIFTFGENVELYVYLWEIETNVETEIAQLALDEIENQSALTIPAFSPFEVRVEEVA